MQLNESGIFDVWAENLEKAFSHIRRLVEEYPYVAMDTEFPGVVARPIGAFNKNEYNYQTLRVNVDMLRLIQLGISFSDENGNPPPTYPSTWQFHFKFDLNDEMYAQDSVDLLKRAGIDFKRHNDYGISLQDFGEGLISSGLVLNSDVKWIAFHSGYDLGYLIKILTCLPLPKKQSQFFEVVRDFFPCLYDVKYMMKSCRNLKGGLQDLADDLEVKRIGPQHQAGSDSLLTLHTYFKMKQLFFEDQIDDDKYCGVMFGLGLSWANSGHALNTNIGHMGGLATSSGTISNQGNFHR